MSRLADWDRPCSKCGTSAKLLKFHTRRTRAGVVVRQSWCTDCKRVSDKQSRRRVVEKRLKNEKSAKEQELYRIYYALQRLTKRVVRLLESDV